MTTVDLVKKVCKERKISIHKLEMDCGWANGYIGQLRKGVLPDDRLKKVAEYLRLPVSYFINGGEEVGEKEKPLVKSDEELTDYLQILKDRPEMLMLFSISKKAKKADVEAAAKIIEALRERNGDYEE